ncbi:hypothetical protein [Tessaracoccus sp. Z1128]
MRRRRAEADDHNPVPEKLRRFRTGEWPGARPIQQWDNYAAALDQWHAEHPDVDTWQWTETPGDIEWNPDLDEY